MTALLAFGQIERNLQCISDAIYRQIWAKFFETTSKEVTPFDDFGKSFDINRKVFENFQKFFGWKFLEVNVKDVGNLVWEFLEILFATKYYISK